VLVLVLVLVLVFDMMVCSFFRLFRGCTRDVDQVFPSLDFGLEET